MRLEQRVAMLGWLAVGLGCADKTTPAGEGTPNVQTQAIEYQQGGTALQGFVAWDAGREGKRPGVLVVHEWWGHNEHARNAARKLAEAGYVALALDMYGKGKVTAHPDSANAFMSEALKDPAVVAQRFDAALAQLKQNPNVDTSRIAAIGYCFGGAVVLSMARAGADLDAVASFHGALPPGQPPVDSGSVKARVLIMTGAADPMIPAAQVTAFTSEMQAAGARIEAISYPDAKHSFTNPRADSVGMEGLAYNAAADQQSWAAMLRLLQEVFRP